MCSGCSGNYEADGEWEEMHQQNSGESGAADFLRIGMSADVREERNKRPRSRPARSDFESGGILGDDYDVFVSDESIVEVRRIGRFSPGIRSPTLCSRLFRGENGAIFRRLGMGSAKDYGTPQQSRDAEILHFEVADKWRDPRELSAFRRVVRAVLGLLR